MTLLDMARENLRKARAKLLSGTYKRALNAGVNVEQMADWRQAGKEPKDKETLEEFKRALDFLDKRCTVQWKDFCRQVDMLRCLEKKGWL